MEAKIMVVTRAKAHNEGKRPTIKLSGLWLNEIGFENGKMFSAEYSVGSIFFRLQPDNSKLTYINISRQLRKNNSGTVLQVKQSTKNRKTVPSIDLAGLWLEQYGFKIGSILAVKYEYGLIEIILFDSEKIRALVN